MPEPLQPASRAEPAAGKRLSRETVTSVLTVKGAIGLMGPPQCYALRSTSLITRLVHPRECTSVKEATEQSRFLGPKRDLARRD